MIKFIVDYFGICLHQWTPWIDATQGDYDIQVRKCILCNKLKKRYL